MTVTQSQLDKLEAAYLRGDKVVRVAGLEQELDVILPRVQQHKVIRRDVPIQKEPIRVI